MYGLIIMLILSTPLLLLKSEVIHDPTITPNPDFSAEDLADTIHKEINKFFVVRDLDKIARRVFHLSSDQRMKLSTAYKERHGGDIRKELTDVEYRNMKGLYDYAFLSPPSLLAKLINEGIEKGNDKSMEEIMCAQDNQMKSLIKESYKSMYQKDLEDDFKRYKSDDQPYQEAMMKYCWPPREEQLKIDEKVAIDEANALYDLASDSDKEKFKSKLKEILGKYTEGDLKLIFEKYTLRGVVAYALSGQKPQSNADEIFTGDEKSAYSTLVRYIENTCRYYRDELLGALPDNGKTDVNCINRITLTRSERDMMCIANAYKNTSGHTLTEDLDSKLNFEDRYVECIRVLCGKK